MSALAAKADEEVVFAAICAIVERWNQTGIGPVTLRWYDNGSSILYSNDEALLFETRPGKLEEMLLYVEEQDRTLRLPPGFNGASPAKSRRGRPPDPAVTARRKALIDLLRELEPATVRQVFYQATVRGLVEKTEGGYGKVQTDLVLLRRNGVLPYSWLADNTRWQRKPRTFASIEAALADAARLYRKSLWADADAYVEAWLEKDALSGVIYPITSLYDVPLMVARGYASLSFLYSAAEYIGELTVPAHIYHLGDYDPSGQDAARAIEKDLRELAPHAEIYFTRIAVTPQQIAEWALPSRPTKQTDSRAAKFGSDVSVELDAIEPNRLRDLVEEAIVRHLPRDQLAVLQAAEASERAILQDMVGRLRDGAAA